MINTIENLHGILDNLYDGVYIVDKSRKIIYWNKAAEDISGYKYSDVVGSHCFNDILQHIDSDGNPLCRQGCPLIHTIEEGQIKETEVFLHHKTGYRVPILVKALPLKNENGETIGAIEIFSENSKHKNILKKMKDLENLAMLDELTQIPNRRYIENLIKESIEHTVRKALPVKEILRDHFEHSEQGEQNRMEIEKTKNLQKILMKEIMETRKEKEE